MISPIADGLLNNQEGTIVVELVDAAGYSLADPDAHKTSVMVNDFGEISISSDYNNVLPDSELEFEVMVDPAPATPIDVAVTASDGTNSSLAISPTSPLSIGTSDPVTVRVSTLPDSSGNLTLTLGTVTGYTSAAPLVIPVESPTTPAILSIASSTTPVTEADNATITYTITADTAVDKDITVEVDVSDFTAKGTDFVENGVHYERLPANETSVDLVIPIKTNATASTDGVVVATIQNGAGYTHTSPTNTARVEIHDTENTTPVEVSSGTGFRPRLKLVLMQSLPLVVPVIILLS